MKLLTKEILNKVPKLYAQDGKGMEAVAYAKFFDPCSAWTWYMTEYDPEEGRAFGLVVGQESELGYFSVVELQNYRGRLGLGIERDRSFSPTKLSEIPQR